MKKALYNLTIRTLKLVPKSLREPFVASISSLRVKKARNLKTPTSLVFFITNKCNARCKHCFYWKELNKAEYELNIDQIKKIANSLKDSYSIVITGGEPFLRKDIYEICKAFDKKIKTLRLATNGFMTDTVYDTINKIIKNCEFKNIDIQISIDGPKELHDSIRCVKGSFNNAIKTIKKLKTLAKNNLNIEIVVAINKKNHNKIEELVKSVINLKIPMNFIITRSSNYGVFNLPKQVSSEISTKEKSITDLSVEELKDAFKKLKNLNHKLSYKFWPVENQLYLKYGIDILDKKIKLFPCYAGIVDGTIYPNGDVALCELTKPIGNLKDYNLNFYKLWHSEKANAMRKNTRQCFCIHGCNLATSISLTKKYVNDVLIECKKTK